MASGHKTSSVLRRVSGSRTRAAMPSAAARAPDVVMIHGTRYATALRREPKLIAKPSQCSGKCDLGSRTQP
jgi:hypothetical protein